MLELELVVCGEFSIVIRSHISSPDLSGIETVPLTVDSDVMAQTQSLMNFNMKPD